MMSDAVIEESRLLYSIVLASGFSEAFIFDKSPVIIVKYVYVCIADVGTGCHQIQTRLF